MSNTELQRSNSGSLGSESWSSSPLDIGAMPPKIHAMYKCRFAFTGWAEKQTKRQGAKKVSGTVV